MLTRRPTVQVEDNCNEKFIACAFVSVDTIHNVRDSLVDVKLKLLGDCRKALAEAEERSRKLGEGSEKMTDIASKARRLSEKQELDAVEVRQLKIILSIIITNVLLTPQIEQMAGEALSLANTASKLAVEGLEEQMKTTGQIQTVMVTIVFSPVDSFIFTQMFFRTLSRISVRDLQQSRI